MPEITIPFSLKIKDPGSAATHFVGAIASIVAAPFLIAKFIHAGADALSVVSAAVFVISMLLLYSASTVYHTVVSKPATDKLLKKIDHMMIFVLIAGTYSPICLTALRSGCGIYLLAGIWGLAAIGMIFKFFWVTCPKWVSSTIYIGMGWLCVFAIPEILHTIPLQGFLFLLAGGLVYTVGGVLYAMKFTLFNNRHKYFGSHEIFHLLVMLGNLLQFITIYNYLV
ncbi:MAG: hemolysin III family protein [Eubacteriales bacterium]|nr:hemolysin III family protein [Eubacteriales bacterium]